MKNLFMALTTRFASPSGEDSPRDGQGRYVHWYAIVNDLARIYVRTVPVKADYLVTSLKDAGIERVCKPIPAFDFDNTDYWCVEISVPDADSTVLYNLYCKNKHDALTFATLLSSVFHNHLLRVRKYNHTRFVVQCGDILHSITDFDLDRCRTQYGAYRLPPDWL
jgi:hypothetical protein